MIHEGWVVLFCIEDGENGKKVIFMLNGKQIETVWLPYKTAQKYWTSKGYALKQSAVANNSMLFTIDVAVRAALEQPQKNTLNCNVPIVIGVEIWSK